MDLADLKERENSLFTKLQQFETELAEAREQIDQLKSTKTKTKQELRNLVGEKEQHLVLLQKCSELSQKCDAINFAEVEKSHDEVSYQIQIFANQYNQSFDLNVIFVFFTAAKIEHRNRILWKRRKESNVRKCSDRFQNNTEVVVKVFKLR